MLASTFLYALWIRRKDDLDNQKWKFRTSFWRVRLICFNVTQNRGTYHYDSCEWVFHLCAFYVLQRGQIRTDQKENKIFLLYKGNSDGIGCKVIYEEELPNVWGNAQIFHYTYEEAVSHIWLCTRSLEFPNIWGKFYFIFYQCTVFLLFLTSKIHCPPHPFQRPSADYSQPHSDILVTSWDE